MMTGDLSPDKTNVLVAAQRGVSPTLSTEKSEFAAWHTARSFAIATANELAMAQRAAHAQTVEVQASHLVMISQPEAVVSVIESAAAQR